MPGRSFNSSDYRFSFNGMEKDDEVKGEGNSLDFGARIFDSRLGRWLSLDPLAAKYPFASPYNFGLDNPILFIDPDGREVKKGGGGNPYGTSNPLAFLARGFANLFAAGFNAVDEVTGGTSTVSFGQFDKTSFGLESKNFEATINQISSDNTSVSLKDYFLSYGENGVTNSQEVKESVEVKGKGKVQGIPTFVSVTLDDNGVSTYSLGAGTDEANVGAFVNSEGDFGVSGVVEIPLKYESKEENGTTTTITKSKGFEVSLFIDNE